MWTHERSVSEVRDESTSLTSPELSALLACQPPARHLDFIHNRREHGILFESLLTPVLDYSHLHSLALFHTGKHLCLPPHAAADAAEVNPGQQTHLLPAAMNRNKAALSPPSTDRHRTEWNTSTIIHQHNSYATSKTISHAENKGAATWKRPATSKDITFLKDFHTWW